MAKKAISLKKILNFHLDSVRDTLFFDEKTLVSVSDDYSMCLWNLPDKSINQSPFNITRGKTAMSYSS